MLWILAAFQFYVSIIILQIAMLKLQGLNFDYVDKVLLSDISFRVGAGRALHLQGANGTGKTTLIKLLAGILVPSQGKIYFKDCDIYQDLEFYRRNIAYLGHKNGISRLLSVRENFKYLLQYTSKNYAELLVAFGLDGHKDTLCAVLSAGQLRKLPLVRVMLSGACLWLLDEPLVALDQAARDVFIDILKSHLDRGGAVVLSSHQHLKLEFKYQQEYHLD